MEICKCSYNLAQDVFPHKIIVLCIVCSCLFDSWHNNSKGYEYILMKSPGNVDDGLIKTGFIFGVVLNSEGTFKHPDILIIKQPIMIRNLALLPIYCVNYTMDDMIYAEMTGLLLLLSIQKYYWACFTASYYQ